MPDNVISKWILLIFIITAQGCSSYARMTYSFEKTGDKPGIYYDFEAEDIATIIVKTLPDSISAVEMNQYMNFKDANAIEVYVFSSKERYARYSGSTAKARGSAITNEVYISPIIRDRIQTLVPILKHELSHVHLRQYIGTWRYWTEVPGWFHEGLAVAVSGGGGAEKVSDEEAIAAIQTGRHFVPQEESSIFGHRYAHDFNLEPQMYYRQCYLFVHYLKTLNPTAFQKTYMALIEGAQFKTIWLTNYGKSISQLWDDFLKIVEA